MIRSLDPKEIPNGSMGVWKKAYAGENISEAGLHQIIFKINGTKKHAFVYRDEIEVINGPKQNHNND